MIDISLITGKNSEWFCDKKWMGHTLNEEEPEIDNVVGTSSHDSCCGSVKRN
jgi:hypothetical protein